VNLTDAQLALLEGDTSITSNGAAAEIRALRAECKIINEEYAAICDDRAQVIVERDSLEKELRLNRQALAIAAATIERWRPVVGAAIPWRANPPAPCGCTTEFHDYENTAGCEAARVEQRFNDAVDALLATKALDDHECDFVRKVP
jgi:hypothetical protein